MQTGVLLLAGGRSRRMGTNKALIDVGGRPLIARVASQASHIGPITVVGGAADVVAAASSGLGGQHDVRHIADPEGDVGPFAAVVHAARQLIVDELLVISCDLGRLTRHDVDVLVDARRRTDADVAIPLVDGQRQWHCLSFAPRVMPTLLSAHGRGIRSLHRGFSGLGECAFVSNSPGFSFDVDTPADLTRIQSDIGGSLDQ